MHRLILAALLLTVAAATASAAAKVDSPAPAFTLTDSKGNEHSLADFKGKYVVLEWVNYDCPFVRKHYRSGNMQKLQAAYTDKDVVWLSVCSSAPGKQGYFEGEELTARIDEEKAVPTAYLVDADGAVGKQYDAKTTPHMYVINPEGVLIYAGAIDDKASTDVDDVQGAQNHVAAALDAAMGGKAVAVKSSKPYGCSVKYK